MSRISELIGTLKDRKKQLEKIKKEQEIKRMNCDTIQFYEDTAKIAGMSDGMVIIITPDNEYREYSPSGTTYKKVCQEILDNISDEHFDLSRVEGDFGNALPKEFNAIFIRMASILNGSTVIYYPDHCTDYQMQKLEEFNNDVKSFNASRKDGLHTTFEYNGKDDYESHNLDDLIFQIKNSYTK